MSTVWLSVVIPLFNEEKNVHLLGERLFRTLDDHCLPLQMKYECIFINDGSQDKTFSALMNLYKKRPDCTRIINFKGNFGQHMAIMAGFSHVKGQIIVTLDADLQNPPEEIPKLLQKIQEGYDYVGGYRHERKDTFFRTHISKIINFTRECITNIKMTDQGCMLRAYDRSIVDKVALTEERSAFIPALAYTFACKPTEIEVEHDLRRYGTSKYNLYQLIRLNFDLVTGFSLVPLQLFTILGGTASLLSSLLVLTLIIRRLFIGPELEGAFTLFAILFFLISLLIVGIGFIGEYVGRIFQTLSRRPLYGIKEIVEGEIKETHSAEDLSKN